MSNTFSRLIQFLSAKMKFMLQFKYRFLKSGTKEIQNLKEMMFKIKIPSYLLGKQNRDSNYPDTTCEVFPTSFVLNFFSISENNFFSQRNGFVNYLSVNSEFTLSY